MNFKKWMASVLLLSIVLTMAACANNNNAVFVQSVGDLKNIGSIAPGDRFAGLVVSENVSEIQKDADKTVVEMMVKEGDDVKKGQSLFLYDMEQLQLSLEKQTLELEQLNASIDNYARQIEDLEKEKNSVGSADKLKYTVQIQSLQVDLKEAQLKVKAKEKEVTKSQDVLDNAEVVAPVDGRIQAINESGTDQNGNSVPFITIQKSGAYRIKGTIGELQRGGIVEGDCVRVISRTEEAVFWKGYVSRVDYESPVQGNSGGMQYGMSSDEMTTSSRYPFYVDLESTEGLLLGQHVYMELDNGGQDGDSTGISSAFIAFEEDGSAYVWAEHKGKLEKRPVELGDYNMNDDTYLVISGLTDADFIAFPDPEQCVVGAKTTHTYVEQAPTVEAEVA